MNDQQCRVKLEVLRPGDWIEFNWGYSRTPRYVLRNDPENEQIWLGNTQHLVSAAYSLRYSQLRGDGLKPLRDFGMASEFEPHVVYLGKTKRRRWWRFMPWRDLICPFKPWSVAIGQ